MTDQATAKTFFDLWEADLFEKFEDLPEFCFDSISDKRILDGIKRAVKVHKQVRRELGSVLRGVEKLLGPDADQNLYDAPLRITKSFLSRLVNENDKHLEELLYSADAVTVSKRRPGPERAIPISLAEELLVGLYALEEIGHGKSLLHEFLKPGGAWEAWYRKNFDTDVVSFNHHGENSNKWIDGLRTRLIETILSRGSKKIVRIAGNGERVRAIETDLKTRARERLADYSKRSAGRTP